MSTAEPPVELVPLSAIIPDTATQARVTVNSHAIGVYAKKLDKLPPIELFASEREPGRYYIGDGWHRFHAAKQAERDTIRAHVHRAVPVLGDDGEPTGAMRPVEDGRREAILWGLKANHEHGVQRTLEDVRNAVRIALADPEFKDRSDRYIAGMVGADRGMVKRLRLQMYGPDGQKVRVVTRNGQDIRMDVSSIGLRAADSEPGESAAPELLGLPPRGWACENCGHVHDRP